MSHKLIQSTRYSGELSEILAPPAHPAPEVVAFIKRKDGKRWRLYWEDEFLPGDEIEPLMTVAQHERIVAALTRPAQKVNNVDTPEQQPVYQKPNWENNYGYNKHVDMRCRDEANALVEHLEGLLDAIPEGPLYAAPIVQEVNKI